jgi:hypothetical protein
MPIVELVAKRTLERHPHMNVSVIDLIVLLWLHTNPYDSNRRFLSSTKAVLRMCETIQTPGKGFEMTDDELTQIILASLQKLRERGLVDVLSTGTHFVRATLTQSGVDLIDKSVTAAALKHVTQEFGDNP